MNDDEKQREKWQGREGSEIKVFIDDLEYAATTKKSCEICAFYAGGLLDTGSCEKIKKNFWQRLFRLRYSNVVYEHDSCCEFLLANEGYVSAERFNLVVKRNERYRNKEESEEFGLADDGFSKRMNNKVVPYSRLREVIEQRNEALLELKRHELLLEELKGVEYLNCTDEQIHDGCGTEISIDSFDLGFKAAIFVNGKPVATYEMPFPLDARSIAYSIRMQGLVRSIANDFFVKELPKIKDISKGENNAG